MKRFLLFAGLLVIIGSVSGQNSYPTSKGESITLDGGYIAMNIPETTGGWARGFFNIDNSGNWLGGVGLFGIQANSQFYYMAHGASPWSSGLGLYVKTNGNIGIGTTQPIEKVHVENGYLLLRSTGNTNNSAHPVGLRFSTDNSGAYSQILVRRGGDSGQLGLQFNTYTNSVRETMTLIDDKVGIGNTNPYYKLDVTGTIRAHEVKVNLNDGGADFVFNTDYNLRSLKEVEQFVTKNKHLPEIASAKEMEENGLNMAEFQIQLLQKVEELTLYIIEQEKKHSEKDILIEKLIERIDALEQK